MMCLKAQIAKKRLNELNFIAIYLKHVCNNVIAK